MHFQLIFAGLAALAAAAPLDKASDDKLEGYTPYVSYGGAYYETYTPYSAAVEEEGAKVGTCFPCPNPFSLPLHAIAMQR